MWLIVIKYNIFESKNGHKKQWIYGLGNSGKCL